MKTLTYKNERTRPDGSVIGYEEVTETYYTWQEVLLEGLVAFYLGLYLVVVSPFLTLYVMVESFFKPRTFARQVLKVDPLDED